MTTNDEVEAGSANGTVRGEARRRMMRWWIPGLIVSASIVFVAWLYATAWTLRANVAAAVIPLALVLLFLWYVFLTGLPWRRRFRLLGVGVAAAGLVIWAASGLLRYEGSADGSALPRFVWRWSPEPGYDLPALEVPAAAMSDAPDGAARNEAPEGARDHPRFLGVQGDGAVPDPGLDPDWDARPPELMWRREIGPGWSGFAVVGGRAVTQEQRGDDEVISCYDLATGTPLWAHRNPVRFSEAMGGVGPRATPTIDGGRVFAQGATGILDCLDLATGSLIWSRHVVDEAGAGGNIEWGKSNAPLIVDHLVVVTGGRGGPGLLAYRASDGTPMWTAAEGETPSYSSPILARLAGIRQIVVVHAESVTGHHPTSGAEIWRFPWPGKWPKAAQPVPVGENRLLVCASYGIRQHLLEIAPHEDSTANTGSARDGAGDGGAGDGPAESGLTVRSVWDSNRLKTKFSSPCVKDGFAFGLDEGSLACIDLATGERIWKEGRYGFGQNLLVGGCLLIQAEQGDVVLAAADAGDPRELARLPALDGKTWNPPALAGRFLLVRNDVEAACYRLPLAAGAR